MKSERWVLLMCAPVLVFGAFAWYSAQRPAPVRSDGPFRVVVEGVRSVPATAYDAWQNHPLAWDLVLAAKGDKPAWWGKPISARSGFSTEMPEADCRVVAFENGRARPLKTDFTRWTTGWDAKIQRYTARLELGAPDVKPADEVRWQGRIEIRESNKPPVSPTVRYDVGLKKVGEKWNIPQFSRDPKLTVRRLTITSVKKDEDEARITFFSTNGGLQRMSKIALLDGRGQRISFPFSNEQIGAVPMTTGCCLSAPPKKGAIESFNLQQGTFSWSVLDLRQLPRDVTLVAVASAHERWPLEIRFPLKRNGKILRGNVPFNTRPAPPSRN